MATHEKASPEVDKCRCLLQGLAKNLADRLYGSQGPPWGTSFAQLERIALGLSHLLRQHFLHLVLSRQATAFLADPDPALCRCPSCAGDTRACDPEPRLLQSRAGDAEWSEPHRYCPTCRKAFFPQSRSLGIDLGHYSPALLELICYAGANKPSFREASLDLRKLGSLDIHEKQVERLSKRIGSERLAQREEQVARFLALPLGPRCDGVPAGLTPPGAAQVAVIMADAGMLQLRHPVAATAAGAVPQAADQQPPVADPAHPAHAAPASEESAVGPNEPQAEADAADPDQEPAPSGRHWHEDKVGLVLTMRSTVHASDPCPEVPATFLDPGGVAALVRGLKKSAALLQDDQAAAEAAVGPPEEQTTPYQGPQVEKRQVVASRQSWPLFGALLASAAWSAGFAPAPRKAFVADGAKAIWKVWKTRFGRYVPILDFIHALSYVWAAAQAVGSDAAHSWQLYKEWLGWVWQGKVGRVIERLKEWQLQQGRSPNGEGASSAPSVVARTLGYLQNNRSKMNYATYRRLGLPIVSSLVESMVKQISRRVKGTEKFWTDEGAEAILQLRADYLSDGDIMAQFWQRRQEAATGQRCYRPRD